MDAYLLNKLLRLWSWACRKFPWSTSSDSIAWTLCCCTEQDAEHGLEYIKCGGIGFLSPAPSGRGLLPVFISSCIQTFTHPNFHVMKEGKDHTIPGHNSSFQTEQVIPLHRIYEIHSHLPRWKSMATWNFANSKIKLLRINWENAILKGNSTCLSVHSVYLRPPFTQEIVYFLHQLMQPTMTTFQVILSWNVRWNNKLHGSRFKGILFWFLHPNR
jgi:hypothetical protein